MVHYDECSIHTRSRCELISITEQVSRVVSASGIGTGMCTVSSLHTTAGITINENADPDVVRDIVWMLGRLVPADPSFHHGEGNSDSHIKASMTGLSVTVPIKGETPVLGTWQAVYFCEFDGPRQRRFSVTCIGE